MPSEPGSIGAWPSRWRSSQYSWNQPTCPISQIGGSTSACGAPSIWASLSPSSSSSSTRLASSRAATSASAVGASGASSIVGTPIRRPSVSAIAAMCTPSKGCATLTPTFRGVVRGRSPLTRKAAPMRHFRILLALAMVGALGVVTVALPRADAQGQTIKIGVLFDHSGPFSAAGSLNCWRGAKMMIDMINEKGGVLGKYKIVQVDGDSQSKAEVAINEAERLLNV